MRTENWCEHDIRFIEVNGEWWAILKDICDALGLRTDKVSQRLDSDMLTRVQVETDYIRKDDHPSEGVISKRSQWMLAVNEVGIYEALFASRRLEARKFRRWSAGVMKRLRTTVGLEGYEVMRMTESEIQERIDDILDCLYWDDETGVLMRSVTVQGGNADQVPFMPVEDGEEDE